MVRPMVRGVIGSPYGGSSFHDGISYSAETGRVVLKAVGAAPTITTLTSAFTFTGGNQSMYRASSGLLVQAVTDTPRIEYDASGNCLGLLMEAARTNLCLQSQDLTTTWADVNTVVISANSTTAPDGTLTADTITDNGGGSIKGKEQSFTVANDSLTHTASVFILKTSGGTSMTAKLSVLLSGGTGVNTNVYLNTDTGVIGSGTATVENYGLYWRVSASVTNNTTGNTTLRVQYYPAVNTHGVYTDNVAVQGSSVVWGFQLEKASFASSYIPTTTVAVARTADRCIRTLSSEFSATAGTLVIAGDVTNSVGATPALAAFHNNAGTGAEEMILYANAGARRWLVTDGGVAQGNVLGGSITDGVAGKMASVYAANDLDLAVNGTMSGLQDTSATLPTITHLDLMRQDASAITLGHIRRLDYYPTRQPNAFLQSATS